MYAIFGQVHQVIWQLNIWLLIFFIKSLKMLLEIILIFQCVNYYKIQLEIMGIVFCLQPDNI
jgi:hypothetical protein